MLHEKGHMNENDYQDLVDIRTADCWRGPRAKCGGHEQGPKPAGEQALRRLETVGVLVARRFVLCPRIVPSWRTSGAGPLLSPSSTRWLRLTGRLASLVTRPKAEAWRDGAPTHVTGPALPRGCEARLNHRGAGRRVWLPARWEVRSSDPAGFAARYCPRS